MATANAVTKLALPGGEEDPLNDGKYGDLTMDQATNPIQRNYAGGTPNYVEGGDFVGGQGIVSRNMGAMDSPPAPGGGAEPPTVPGTPPAAEPRTANTYTPTTQTVNPNQTVSGQVTDLLKADNPLMQTARGQAAQAANSRGLLNSSMAVQAGEQAAINSALPIASQDAQTYNRVGSENAAAQNTAGQFNAGSQNQFGLSAQQASQDRVLQQMKGDQAKAVADIEAQYKTILQSNASASQQFTSVMDNIGRILNDPNTTAEQKQAGVDKQIELLKSAMTVIGSIGNIDLTSLLDFSAISQTPQPGTPGAPPSAPPPPPPPPPDDVYGNNG